MQDFLINAYIQLADTLLTACLAEVSLSYWIWSAEKFSVRRILAVWAALLVAHREVGWLISYLFRYI